MKEIKLREKPLWKNIEEYNTRNLTKVITNSNKFKLEKIFKNYLPSRFAYPHQRV